MGFNDIPNEILEQILRLTIDLPSPSFLNPPCHIAEVSRLWHAQSLNFPEIRSILPLITPHGTRRSLPISLQVESPLCFAICNFSPLTARGDYEMLSGRSKRWGHAEFLSLHPDVLRALSVHLINKVPLLHTVKLRLMDEAKGYAGYLYAFENAPALRRMEVESRCNIFLKAPFAQLEEYLERSSAAIGIVQVLTPDSQIRTLSYYSDNPIPIVTTRQPHGPIPHLHTLNLQLQYTALVTLLSPLSLPALRRLRVVSDSADALDNIRSLISRSGSRLTTLSLLIHLPESLSNRGKLIDHIPLLRDCGPSLHNLELNLLRYAAFQEIVDPSNPDFIPHLREFIAYLPDSSYLDSVSPLSSTSRDGQRVGFVRLIFPSAAERLSAHKQLEIAQRGISCDVPPGLLEAVRTLEEEWNKHTWPQKKVFSMGRLLRTFSDKGGKKLDDALSYIESFMFKSPLQIMLSRVYSPLYLLSDSDIGESHLRIAERAKALLLKLEAILPTDDSVGPLIQWRTEDEFALIRTGLPTPASLASLINAERSHHRSSSDGSPPNPPWGFANLERRVGGDS
ncbi:hypothetical protein DFP72DRAFT_372483 [Ephemerocybe angulata]|uniref:F-box domain-containing protein n=1 Tax=Ephemerocybe angulata TaxID=980116 RepID=A0A8H6HXU9_9AGAR|nr:hypothetical protein DFP72DRAFT_372483 [Tulosesus angulatus]